MGIHDGDGMFDLEQHILIEIVGTLLFLAVTADLFQNLIGFDPIGPLNTVPGYLALYGLSMLFMGYMKIYRLILKIIDATRA